MKTLSAIAISILSLLSVGAACQTVAISGQAIDQYGSPLPGATVRVCSITSTGTPCTPVSTIYYDYTMESPAPNPYSADQYGNYSFFAPATPAPNMYIVQITPTSGITWSYVVNGPGCSLAGCTLTGSLIVGGSVTATLFNATTYPYYEINGTQISSSALSDSSSLARLNVANTFTATQTAPIFNATSMLEVGGSQISTSNLSDSSNIARIGSSNTFTGTTQTAPVFNASTGFTVGGAAPTNYILLGDGSHYVGSSTIPYSIISGSGSGPFSGTGIPYATSTTASSAATSSQVVSLINSSPSTILSTSVLPTATSSTLGIVRPDNSTITISNGVLTAATQTSGTNYYFTFTGCTLNVSGNSTNCRATQLFSGVTPVVPTQSDTNYFISCTTYTGEDWGSSTGVNVVSTTGFTYSENVDRYNGVSATVSPVVWCHLHRN